MRRTLLLVLAVMLLAPTAASTWYVGGTFEPDTPYDTAEWMFQEPPPAGSSRVYFNVITMSHETVAGASPNVGFLHTRNEPAAEEFHFAVFGVWKDCNEDGYIGMAEQALREYSAALLASDSVCKAATGTPGVWPEGAHNYNGWVSEYVPIARSPTPAPPDKRIYRDDAAMVWGDFQRPDERHTMRSCALFPFPRGTYATTGGSMNYVECRLEQKGLDGLGTFNLAVDAIGDPLGLRFSDENDARTGTVGQVFLGGHEDTAYSPATVWDCGGDSTRVGDALNETPVGPMAPNVVSNLVLREAEPQAGNLAQPSAAALVNHTYEGAAQDCDTSNDDGRDVYEFLEADFQGVDPDRKTEAEWNFEYRSGGRGGIALGLVLGGGSSGAPSNDGGIGWLGYSASGWYSDSTWSSKAGPSILRIDAGAVGIAPAYYLSFFAHAGSATDGRNLDRPAGRAEYGSYHCGENESGIHQGWVCDADLWYRNPDGTPYDLEYPHARPGQPYEFRDVDCYDGSNDLGVPLGAPAYGPDPCEPMG